MANIELFLTRIAEWKMKGDHKIVGEERCGLISRSQVEKRRIHELHCGRTCLQVAQAESCSWRGPCLLHVLDGRIALAQGRSESSVCGPYLLSCCRTERYIPTGTQATETWRYADAGREPLRLSVWQEPTSQPGNWRPVPSSFQGHFPHFPHDFTTISLAPAVHCNLTPHS